MRGRLFVVSGPSGVGKNALISALRKRVPDMFPIITATTRQPRAGEVDKIHYHFVTEERFLAQMDMGAFLEANRYGSNLYGTYRWDIEDCLKRGVKSIIDVDVNGARNIKQAFPEARTIFIMPPKPAIETLRARLSERGKDRPEVIEERLRIAEREMAESGSFDYVVVNDVMEDALTELVAIVADCRIERQSAKRCA